MTDSVYIDNQLADTMNELQKCIHYLGIDKTIDGLRKLRTNGDNHYSDRISYVISIIIDKMDITEKDFFQSKSWSEKRCISIGMATFFLSRELELSAKDISKSLSKSIPCCWANMKKFQNLNPKYDNEKLYLSKYDEIKDLFLKYIKNDPNGTERKEDHGFLFSTVRKCTGEKICCTD